jgi:hypothetical protein
MWKRVDRGNTTPLLFSGLEDETGGGEIIGRGGGGGGGDEIEADVDCRT